MPKQPSSGQGGAAEKPADNIGSSESANQGVDSVCINSGTAAASDQQVLLMTISLSLLLFALSNRLPPLFVGFREGQAPSRTSLQQML
ncbi:TPA: hypothetical protein ACH3X3_001373 [Trebouxia sp. C0006]